MLKQFKDEMFENQIKNEDVTCIQFSANFCSPCKVLKPLMDKLSNEFQANFYLADIEEDGINLASAAGVRAVPTVIVYKKGIEVDRQIGGTNENHMRQFLEKNISIKQTSEEEVVSASETAKEEVVSATETSKEEVVSATETSKEEVVSASETAKEEVVSATETSKEEVVSASETSKE